MGSVFRALYAPRCGRSALSSPQVEQNGTKWNTNKELWAGLADIFTLKSRCKTSRRGDASGRAVASASSNHRPNHQSNQLPNQPSNQSTNQRANYLNHYPNHQLNHDRDNLCE